MTRAEPSLHPLTRLAAIALALATALPACAQRAGHASFAPHSTPTARAGFPSFASGPRNAGPALRSPYLGARATVQPFARYAAPAPGARPSFYSRYPDRRRLYPGRSVGFYPYPLVVGPYAPFLDSFENYDAFDPDDPNNAPQAAVAPEVGDAEPAPPAYEPYPAPPQPSYAPAPEPSYEPAPQPSYAAAAQPPPAPEVQNSPGPADTVTLIFNNGRPPEQIQNFLATRTTLTVINGNRRHEIPIADLDLAATAKVNHEAGVDFQLPTGTP